ncbi:hypothetical protein ZIOFF_074058 [Zingiber officinale]|uniref:Uncharacterized protein n=1 Tax=Zingiber officinale TaxID=94328 RepID=A0A8J5BCX8_ZINOF|nr:hypothetical protein ZIOFF_074058 [Zingiber officinale]
MSSSEFRSGHGRLRHAESAICLGVLPILTLGLLPRLRPFSTDAPGGCSVAVMQVTRSNFNAALEGLRACVEESDFVAVDLEMTGVTSAPWRDSFEFDRSDVRYLKLKDSAEKFAVVQFGVCPFRWDSSKGSFFAHPHNFYIFPRNELPLHGPPDDFLWQVVKKHFNDLMYVRVVDEDNSWQRRVVYVDTNEDKAVLMKDVLEDLRKNAEKRIKSSVGFRHVVDLLASTGKLIVGHNCLLDLAHIYNKFFGPLPSSLTEFVQAVHEKFPHIVDTKHLLNSNQTIQHLMKKNSKSLSSAFSLLCPNVSSNFQTTSKSYLRFEDTKSKRCISHNNKE